MIPMSKIAAHEGPVSGAMVDPHARGLFDADIALALCDPRAPLGGLLSPERAGMGRMVDKRQREFTAGRVAAHRAMAELGYPAQPVLPGADRAPIWPDGLMGSLSHCDSLCICAMGRSRDVQSLGVDVEEDAPLDAELFDAILTPPERNWLNKQPADEMGRLARLLFSAKETAYKAQYPLSRTVLDFESISIELGIETGRYDAIFMHSVGPFATGTRLSGRFVRAQGLILTGITLRRRPGG